ncbi:MAG: EamA family transporter [Candidatus Margulisiibacteriota bacterium]
MINYLVLTISILLAVTGQLLMKRGMMLFGSFPVSQLLFKIIPMFLNPWVFSGLVCFGLSSIFWLVVLSRLELSLVYPMVSVAYVLVAMASWIFFRENLSLIRWLGIAVIILGVYLISRS